MLYLLLQRLQLNGAKSELDDQQTRLSIDPSEMSKQPNIPKFPETYIRY